MNPEVRRLIELHRLTPLPVEGTWFRGTWRSRRELPSGKPMGTAMIGLYSEEPPSFSLFHRLTEDETWHFYGGAPLRLVLLHPDGRDEDVYLGPGPGQHVQYVVPAGTWQAGHVTEGGGHALFGCTLAPGFVDEMFEGGTRAMLMARYPRRAADIERFACPDGETRMPGNVAT